MSPLTLVNSFTGNPESCQSSWMKAMSPSSMQLPTMMSWDAGPQASPYSLPPPSTPGKATECLNPLATVIYVLNVGPHLVGGFTSYHWIHSISCLSIMYYHWLHILSFHSHFTIGSISCHGVAQVFSSHHPVVENLTPYLVTEFHMFPTMVKNVCTFECSPDTDIEAGFNSAFPYVFALQASMNFSSLCIHSTS